LLQVAQARQPLLQSQRFDIVLIDCPPSLGLLTLNAFAAAEGLLVPLQCEYYALEGISMLTRIVNQLRDTGVNPRLEILGVLMTMFDGRTIRSSQAVAELWEHFAGWIFERSSQRRTGVAECRS